MTERGSENRSDSDIPDIVLAVVSGGVSFGIIARAVLLAVAKDQLFAVVFAALAGAAVVLSVAFLWRAFR